MASKRAALTVNGFRAHTTTRTLSLRAAHVHGHGHAHPRQLIRAATTAVRFASSAVPTTSQAQLGRTGLYELHAKYGAKFVPFGGYEMPVQYSDLSIVDSHNWTRDKASLFDVGHM